MISANSFLEACANGRIHLIEKYIEEGGDLRVEQDGCLWISMVNAQFETVNFLLKHGISFKDIAKANQNLLTHFLSKGDLYSVEFLISNGFPWRKYTVHLQDMQHLSDDEIIKYLKLLCI